MDLLLRNLQSIHQLSDATIEYIFKNLQKKTLVRNEFFLRKGRICEEIGFVSSGLLRCYYEKDDNEVCTWFMHEGSFITSVISFFKQMPSYEFIQAIEPSEIYYINHANLQYIYNHFPEFNYIAREILQQYYCLSEERLLSIRNQTPKERYDFLMNNYPEIIRRVPANYIASYIDISIWTLSRIKQRR